MTLELSTNGSNATGEGSALWEHFLQEGYDYKRPKRGDIVTGIILELHSDTVIVDIGVKREGFVPASDLKKLDEETLEGLQVGNEVPVFIERPWNADGDLVVSIARGKEVQDWEEAQRLLESGEMVELQVDGYNRGGVTVKLGQIRGFVPSSHLVGLGRNLDPSERQLILSQKVGDVLRLNVLEVDRSRRRLVLSQREAERAYRRLRKQELLESLEIGQVVKGTVTSLQSFGAFVDVGGADGLLHVGEISHRRVSHPREMLSVGQELETAVIRLDKERKRIGLSLKALQPDPWQSVSERYYPGQLVEAVVTNVVDFGAFAELEAGIEGLIHISRLSDRPIKSPIEVVATGDRAMLRVLRIDARRRRISLSLKDAPQWIEADSEDEGLAAEAQESLADRETPSEAQPSAGKPEPTAEVEPSAEKPEPAADVEPSAKKPEPAVVGGTP